MIFSMQIRMEFFLYMESVRLVLQFCCSFGDDEGNMHMGGSGGVREFPLQTVKRGRIGIVSKIERRLT